MELCQIANHFQTNNAINFKSIIIHVEYSRIKVYIYGKIMVTHFVVSLVIKSPHYTIRLLQHYAINVTQKATFRENKPIKRRGTHSFPVRNN